MRTHPRRPRETGRFGMLLAAALAMTLIPSVTEPLTTPARADTAVQPKVAHDADAVTVSVPATGKTPGYTVDIATGELALTTERAGEAVLSTAGGDTGACDSAPAASGSTPPRSPTGHGRTASSPSSPTPRSTAPASRRG
ncbi:hypothetical protein SVIO_107590 [Streptomyces violaceusniger]|uniref:Uncharacterized protein n=1 Tax=Streptomyces violaceusniger TaxID=68280 RepID=A0A4D4LLG4_STRVO|nr:hypothetical protein SVIO_107590 [Streptomyces violaceusniger]